VSLNFIIFIIGGSIWLLIVNASFIRMPWETWFASKVSVNLAIINTLLISITLALSPLTYLPKLRPKAIYLVSSILIVLGSFWKLSYNKAPLKNGITMATSVIILIVLSLYLKRKKAKAIR
jgi:hypothetical protein